MADRISLQLQTRTELGKKVRRLRRQGVIPVHLYGPGIDPQALQCQGPELTSTISKAGRNTPISVTVEGETGEHLAFVREVQRDPLRGSILHVDFLRTEATQRVSAEVPVVITGDSPGARETGGTVVQQLYAVTVEALPLDMPRDISVDLVALTQEEPVIRVGDITLPATVTMLNEANDVVARIQAARVVEVEVVEGAPEAEEAEAAESQQEA